LLNITVGSDINFVVIIQMRVMSKLTCLSRQILHNGLSII